MKTNPQPYNLCVNFIFLSLFSFYHIDSKPIYGKKKLASAGRTARRLILFLSFRSTAPGTIRPPACPPYPHTRLSLLLTHTLASLFLSLVLSVRPTTHRPTHNHTCTHAQACRPFVRSFVLVFFPSLFSLLFSFRFLLNTQALSWV